MSYRSHVKHRSKYAPSPDLLAALKDVRTLLEAIRTLPISKQVKKRMLVHALWEVAFATGNSQSKFEGRYRSGGVLQETGLKIQRDHVFRKRALIEQLLGAAPDLDTIIARAECCLVTEEEHRRLGAVDAALDGWERYRSAGIAVYDMAVEPPRLITEHNAH